MHAKAREWNEPEFLVVVEEAVVEETLVKPVCEVVPEAEVLVATGEVVTTESTVPPTAALKPKRKPAGTLSPERVPPVTNGAPKVRVTPPIGDS